MSLSDRMREAARLPALAAILVLGLSGCIHPMYGANGVNAKLAQIEVAPIPERVGHYLAEELKFETDGSGDRPPPRYRLTIYATSQAVGTVVNIGNQRADAATVTVAANFTLAEIVGGRTVTSGSANASASYDRTEQRFANVRAARDAEIRAATVLADQIRTRLAVALLSEK
jgi:LPS-assembly lipoprotein